jgi:hypothetical protein
MSVQEFLREEAPQEGDTDAIDRAIARFTSTTRFLLALAEWTETEGADLDGAELIRKSAAQYAAHEAGLV